jgi:hypothetical protein
MTLIRSGGTATAAASVDHFQNGMALWLCPRSHHHKARLECGAASPLPRLTIEIGCCRFRERDNRQICESGRVARLL